VCGFVVMLSREPVEDRCALARACDSMARRGPDASREWWSDDRRVGIGHRRLAVLDLNDRATQPMWSVDGRFAIVYNGEIYNFKALQDGLREQGAKFRTSSDTEVLLELFRREREQMLTRLRGMFALAIWDTRERELFVARDPYGIKPLYVAEAAGAILVGSQVKALLATGLVSREPDAVGQAGFWLFGSVPGPRTWFRDISNLPPGHWALVKSVGMGPAQPWWDIGDSFRNSPAVTVESRGVGDQIRSAVRESVRAHLVADVPVGVFLSGGVDSGSLAALMVEQGASSLQGVTLAFEEFAGRTEDEVPAAACIAREYGIRHHVRVVTKADFDIDWPRIIAAMDQPTVDGVNTWYASKAAADLGLKVVVSGVGGDELLQGYSTFKQLSRVTAMHRLLGSRTGASSLIRVLCGLQAARSGNPRWKLVPELAGTLEGAWFIRRSLYAPEELPGLMGRELAAVAMQDLDPVALVRDMVGSLPSEPRVGAGLIESKTYLRNQLLRDSDWTSMDHSVELRTPLVDSWLLQDMQGCHAWLRGGAGKRYLASTPAKPLPRAIAGRQKTGFGIPVATWLGLQGPRRGHELSRWVARYVAAHCYG
jgi:asparagine synthase (glutamine-hydrolysing)